jgi:hypothetical protein
VEPAPARDAELERAQVATPSAVIPLAARAEAQAAETCALEGALSSEAAE